MSRMDSLRSWKGLLICSVLFTSLISLAKDNPFLICLPQFGEGDKTCYRPSIHYTVWNSCIEECKNDKLEFAIIADNHTWLDITLKLLRQGDVYWVAASRNVTNWYWSNGTSLSSQLLKNVHTENNGNCLSLNAAKAERSLQSRNCQEYSLCLCQKYQRGIHTTSQSSTFNPTTQQSIVTSDSLTFTIPTTRSLQTPYSTKASTEKTTTTQQSRTTTASNHTTFCESTSSGGMCYYYYKDLLNQYDATTFCKKLEKEMFHFDNDDATEQFVRETLKNIDGGIWLGAVKLNSDWIWLNGQKFTNAWTGSIFSTDTAYENSSCLIMVPSIRTLARMGCQKIFSVLCQDTEATISTSSTQSESNVTITDVVAVATTTVTTTEFKSGSSTANSGGFYSLIPPMKSLQTPYITKAVTEIPGAKNEQSRTTTDKHRIHTTSQSSTVNSNPPMTSVQTTYTSTASTEISKANSQQSGVASVNPFPIFLHGIEEGDKTYFLSSKEKLSWDFCMKYCKSYKMEFAMIPNNNTWINLVLSLVSYGGVFWVSAYRNATEWHWVNVTRLSSNTNATSLGSQNVTSTPPADHSYIFKTSTTPMKLV